uniref:Membrane associated guanylate kinase, WW and PDZ domain containing 3 n=1 Tax=Sinocyclocheilus grahami TaxID=75366 RepID=A0A672Q229_SINGR
MCMLLLMLLQQPCVCVCVYWHLNTLLSFSSSSELPYGWEEIDDPQYGTYYVDHINQRTQFENPVLEAKRKLGLDTAVATQTQQRAAPPPGTNVHLPYSYAITARGAAGTPGFTRDPTQLKGELYHTALRKSQQGFGFTIIGGDRPDEFLQVKNVLADGPAAQDNKMASGDVIVEINGTLVLGKTHADVVHMFQCIPINQYVDMVLCHGYSLPPDVDADNIVTAVPLINGQPLLVKGDALHGSSQELHYVTTDASGRPVIAALPGGSSGANDRPETGMLQPELVSVPIVKGPGGFGFAIADCPLGQKVKMILDEQWCRGLLKGDVIKEINRQNVQTLSHAQVVDILKDLPVHSEVNLLVLRGGKRTRTRGGLSPSPISEQQTKNIGLPRSVLPHSPIYLLYFHVYLYAVPHYKELDVFIKRDQETGFGFRVLGGEGVYIGAIIPQGVAEKEGRLRTGDELVGIDCITVKGKSHKQVLDLMTNAARNGQVLLSVRRKVIYKGEHFRVIFRSIDAPEDVGSGALTLVNGSPRLPRISVPSVKDQGSFDITLHRKDNEGFGFVILTSKNKPPPGGNMCVSVIPHKIGRIIEDSPTDRCGLLNVGDRISSVNSQSIVELSHNDIVQLIKDAGNSVTLTVVPEDGESSPMLELERGPRGFGFSLRGGTEYNMGLYILRLAEDGPALQDGRIHVGDQVVEINGEQTQGISHTRAIELIQAGGNKVLLLLRPQALLSENSEL